MITWVADHRRHHAFADKEGDPHSPWLFGTTPARAGPRLLPRPPGLAVRPRPHQRRPVRPRPAGRPRHRPDRPAVPAAGPLSACSPRRCSAAWSPCPGGARSPRSSGPASCGSRCCTTSPGRSTRSATWSASGPAAAGPGHERLAAGDPVDGRVLAQPAPRRPHLRPPRRRPRPDRHVRPGHLGLREARLGPRRPLAHHRTVWPGSSPALDLKARARWRTSDRFSPWRRGRMSRSGRSPWRPFGTSHRNHRGPALTGPRRPQRVQGSGLIGGRSGWCGSPFGAGAARAVITVRTGPGRPECVGRTATTDGVPVPAHGQHDSS